MAVTMQIDVIKGDITKLRVEAIVNPANSGMTMGGGLAGAILPAKFVIHTPAMERPVENIPVSNVALAMRAILECAEKHRIGEVAVPGLGTGVGRVPYDQAARAMVQVLRGFNSKTVQKIILVASSEELYRAFKEAVAAHARTSRYALYTSFPSIFPNSL